MCTLDAYVHLCVCVKVVSVSSFFGVPDLVWFVLCVFVSICLRVFVCVCCLFLHECMYACV